ncbi:sigma-70 family RNA polymerase sigma factor [Cellulosimicrobium cellulans]|uniref:sigma-70 family RNA polymerase sigma factor n=1 Tax=Cellulosimicrobium cellulans TaxID=1710 RepID=UPI0022AB31C4|nr:sigma-70 family RNA polymerase sigma factor [Cellulosimicrobium cellulans]UKJ64992.1 sigma-70 family RNA polymerase sigma factor [Cellulosimicrobium cellulans]
MHAHHLTAPAGTRADAGPHDEHDVEPAPARADAELADAVRAGDADAYAELWERHAGAGRAAARRLTASYDPDDLLQEAFARILHALQSGAGPTGPFRPYLYTTLRAVAASWSRTPAPFPVEEVPEVADVRDATTEVLERSVTVRAFRRLPERWQSVLWYTEVEGMEPREVGPLLGLSAPATAALAYRAREGLRREWLQAHVATDAVAPGCRWTAERLGDHARGTLSTTTRDRVEEHLTGCLACSIRAEEVDDVASRLRLVLLPLVLGVPAALGAAGTVVAPTAAPAAETPVVTAPAATAPAATAPAAGVAAGASRASSSGAWRRRSSRRSGRRRRRRVVGRRRTGDGSGQAAGALASPGVPADEVPAAPAAPDDEAHGTAVEPGTAPDAAPGPADVPATGPLDPGRTPGTGTAPPPVAEPSTPAAEIPPAAAPSPAPEPPEPDPGTDPGTEEPAPQPPASPVVVSAPAPGPLAVFPLLRGTGAPGASLRVLDAAGTVVGTAEIGHDGAWEVVADGLGAAGEHRLRVVQEAEGGTSAASVPLGPYVFDVPVLLSPGPGTTVTGRPSGLPWEPTSYAVDAEIAGTPGLVVEAFVDDRPTGNLHTLVDTPLVRQVTGLSLGEHSLGLRVVDPGSGAHGPVVTTRFTVVG